MSTRDTLIGRSGPLGTLRVVELGGMGPVPFAGMLLANLGAEVVRFQRPDRPDVVDPVLSGGRTEVAADLNDPTTLEQALSLVTRADAVLEGFRPGVADRLGLGPERLLKAQPRLVYARSTGWNAGSPNAGLPGHDINYIGLSGALAAVRATTGQPVPPPGLVGDFGGAGMLLAVGVLAAVHSARESGAGQVVDTSILAGAAVLTAHLWGVRGFAEPLRSISLGIQHGEAPFYNVYECSDGRYVAVGAFEEAFYAALRLHLQLDGELWHDQFDIERWPAMRAELTRIFQTSTRDEWWSRLGQLGACVTPVFGLDEAPDGLGNIGSEVYGRRGSLAQPEVHPIFHRTPGVLADTRHEALEAVAGRWDTPRNAHNRPVSTTPVTLTGPWRRPKQVLADQTYGSHQSIHDDGTATRLGFAGAPIEGPTHLSQLVPLLLTLWGPAWLERGTISAHFQNPCVEGDETMSTVVVDSFDAGLAKISIEKRDGTPVLTGTAAAGDGIDNPRHEVRQRFDAHTEPTSRRILDQVDLGHLAGGPEPAAITMDEPLGDLYPFTLRRKLDVITEPLSWYLSSSSPWDAPIIPIEMISVLTQYTSGGRIPVREPSVGLFLDEEITVFHGPLCVGTSYELDRQVLGFGESRRTESFWTQTLVRRPGSPEILASVLLHTGILKDSYPE